MSRQGKVRLFLSSTRTDLVPFRTVVREVCQRLSIEFEGMENFGADPRPPLEVCKERVERCDVFIGLYGHRYGSVLPDCNGFSITHLEYRWAVERSPRLIVLPFVVDPAYPWPVTDVDVGPERDHLIAFKEWLNSAHTIRALTTPEQLRDDLLSDLPSFRAQVLELREIEERRKAEERQEAARVRRRGRRRPLLAVDDEDDPDFAVDTDAADELAEDRHASDGVAARWRAALPVPPEPYVVHEYTLMETRRLVGRTRELAEFDAWAKPVPAPQAAQPMMCLNAVGGMGKSAVTWHWFHHHATQAMGNVAGRFWWSFYEADAGFDNFIVGALAYCAARSPVEIHEMSRADREQELLRWLDRTPFLLVLDGLERILMAYSGLDFAHLLDEDLDTRTQNWSFGPDSALPTDRTNAARHRLRETVDGRAGTFLQRLTKVRASRILVTSRLMPSALQTNTGHPVPGCTARTLHGLQPDDAVTLWRKMQVSGDTASLSRLFRVIDHYPLLITALAGEVAVFRPAPGDFDEWRRQHPDFDPFSLRIDQRRSHVLAYAMSGLDENARHVLNTVAAFHSPAPFTTLHALAVETGHMSLHDLDRTLTELEDRGLLGWDRRENRYDMHPVVRGVVWSGLDDVIRRAIFGGLERYFSALPQSTRERPAADEVMMLLEQFNSLVGLGRHADAANLYIDRIESPGFNFENAGLHQVNIAALEALFPHGLQRPPAAGRGRAGAIVAHLSRSYALSGRLREAFELARRSMGLVPTTRLAVTQSLLSEHALALGKVHDANMYARIAVGDQSHPLAESFALQLAWCEAVAGQYEDVLRFLEIQRASGRQHRRLAAQIRMWLGDADAARAIVLSAVGRTDDDPLEELLCQILLAEAWIELGFLPEAAASLGEVAAAARERALIEPELRAMRCLADAHRRLGDVREAREVLDDLAEPANRAGYQLIKADAAHVRSLIEEDPARQLAAASEALTLAKCDGPLYSYKFGVVRATRRINDLLDAQNRHRGSGALRTDPGKRRKARRQP